jgi:hypothetical protein
MMLNIHNSRDTGFNSIYPVPFMETPNEWLGPRIGSAIAFNTWGLSIYIYLSIFLWGMWGDSALSLIQRGFEAPHMDFFVGEIPHKKWGAGKSFNSTKKTVPHKKCGELPTETNAVSLASRGFASYLPNSPRFTTTYTYIFYYCLKTGPSKPCPDRVIRAPFFR